MAYREPPTDDSEDYTDSDDSSDVNEVLKENVRDVNAQAAGADVENDDDPFGLNTPLPPDSDDEFADSRAALASRESARSSEGPSEPARPSRNQYAGMVFTCSALAAALPEVDTAAAAPRGFPSSLRPAATAAATSSTAPTASSAAPGEEEAADVATEVAATEETATDSGEPARPKRTPIVFKSAPPTLAEARKKTNIVPIAGGAGSFTRKPRGLTFYNANRYGRQQLNQEPEEEEEEEPEYSGMVFNNTDFAGRPRQPRRHYDSSWEGEENRPPRRQYDSYYRPRNYHPKQNRYYDHISYNEVLSTEDAENLLKDGAVDRVQKTFVTQHQYALPEEQIRKSLGQNREYLPIGFICPHSKMMTHREYTEKQTEEEKYRTNLVYKLICEKGMLHIEDLWTAYLERNRKEDHPFDGFPHFKQFIFDRAHIFGVDKKFLVFNQNLLVTVAVMRYAHALLHKTPVESAPNLFKAEKASLFYRAFANYMPKEQLSFDKFFERFPAVFKFNKVWCLADGALDIPSVFYSSCLPKRELAKPWVDRSQIFNGVGKVISNSMLGIKIDSEETFRTDMPYKIFVPIEVVDDPEKYPVGTRVAYSGVRLYADHRESVRGTRIELAEQKQTYHDCTVDVWSFEDDEVTETLDETDSTEVRIVEVRAELASREKERRTAIKKTMKAWNKLDLMELYQNVTDHFNFQEFLKFLEDRPYYYKLEQIEEQIEERTRTRYFVSIRPSVVTLSMLNLLIELRGKDGRSVRMEEALEMLDEKNASLGAEDQFTLDDLSQVIRIQKALYDMDTKPRMEYHVSPVVYWDNEHKMMIQI